MFAKINHMAIVSSNHLAVGKFYETIFGMKFAADRRGGFGAVTVRDGYVGLNINSRKPGRVGGLDHFGVEVEDVETAFEILKEHLTTYLIPETPETPAISQSVNPQKPEGV